MKKLALLMSTIVLLAFITSCGDDEPTGPTPTVDFEIDKPFAEVDDEITFTNNTVDGASFSWDFGDGESSSLENPTHEYDEVGEYTVTLTATGSGGIESTSTETIIVGARFVTGFDILTITPENPDGNPWDEDGSAPDFVFLFRRISDGADFIFSLPENFIGLDELPASIGVDGGTVELTNEDWLVFLLDDDAPLRSFGDEEFDTIIGGTINPTALGTVDNLTGEGSMLLSNTEETFQFTINFALRTE